MFLVSDTQNAEKIPFESTSDSLRAEVQSAFRLHFRGLLKLFLFISVA